MHQTRGYILLNDHSDGENKWHAGDTVAYVKPKGKLSPNVFVAMINERVAKTAINKVGKI